VQNEINLMALQWIYRSRTQTNAVALTEINERGRELERLAKMILNPNWRQYMQLSTLEEVRALFPNNVSKYQRILSFL
jgi:hypothetical protein